MPLSEHEQRILEEIERRLAEEDPKLVEQVGRTDLYTHLARRIRLAALAFVGGFVLILLFVVSPWIAALGFVVMVLSALLIYRYLGQLGRDQVRAMQQEGRLSLTGLVGRIGAAVASPPSPFGWFCARCDLSACRSSARWCTTGSPSPRGA
jgi:Protein of unknown function (DUF3040)